MSKDKSKAKPAAQQAIGHAINVRQIVWVPAFNYARPGGVDLGDSGTTISMLATHGWLPREVIDVLYIGDKPEFQEKAVAYVEHLLKELWDKAQTSKDDLELYNIYKDRFGEISKENPPEYLGITGNRRGHCVPLAAKLWRSNKMTENAENGTAQSADASSFLDNFNVSCKVHQELSETDWIRTQVEENELKAAGAVKMDVIGIMATAIRLISLGLNISQLRESYGDNDGQRAGYMAILQNRMPNLGLFWREGMKFFGRLVDSTNPKYISWSKIPYSKLPRLERGTNPEKQQKWNDKLIENGIKVGKKREEIEIEQVLTEEEVDQTLESFMGRGGSETKKATKTRMPDKELTNLSDNSTNKAVKMVANAVAKGDSSAISTLTDLSMGMNALIEIGYDEVLHVSLSVLAKLPPDVRSQAIAEINKVVASYQPAPAPVAETV